MTHPYEPTSVAQHGSALARTTPEIEQVRDGIWAIPLPLPQANVVESTLCYSIADAAGGVHLIDPGWGTDENFARLVAGLKIAGFRIEDVRSITATHVHPDHVGLATRLNAAHGIPVGVHRIELATLANPSPFGNEETAGRWGIPESYLPALRNLARPRSKPTPFVANVALEDGDRLDIPGRDVRVVVTPGHTAGSICLHDAADGVFFTGDHVLPIINPGLGLGGFTADDDPIGAALDSYAKVAAYDDAEVCPGHGYRFRGLAVRAGQIADRHRRRSAEIGALVAADPGASIWEVASHVSWTDGWDNLEPFLKMSALMQTEMHVRHLERVA